MNAMSAMNGVARTRPRRLFLAKLFVGTTLKTRERADGIYRHLVAEWHGDGQKALPEHVRLEIDPIVPDVAHAPRNRDIVWLVLPAEDYESLEQAWKDFANCCPDVRVILIVHEPTQSSAFVGPTRPLPIRWRTCEGLLQLKSMLVADMCRTQGSWI